MRQDVPTATTRFRRALGACIGLATASMLAAPAHAGPREDIEAAMARCHAIPSDRDWLECYEAAAEPMRAGLAAGAARARQGGATPVPQAPAASEPAPLRAVSAAPLRMTSYTFDQVGVFTVTLTDGATWKQIEGDTSHAKWSGPANYEVTIGTGTLASSNLRVRGDPGIYKVQRLR